MTTDFWMFTALTVVFLGGVGWAWWATKQITDAVDAARDTNEQQTEQLTVLRAWWLKLNEAHESLLERQPEPEPTQPQPIVPKRTDTVEQAEVITGDVEAWARAEMDKILARHGINEQPAPRKRTGSTAAKRTPTRVQKAVKEQP